MIKLKKALVLTAAYYSKDLTEQLLELYVEDILSYGIEEERILIAINNYRKDPKNRIFPLPAQLMELFVEKRALIEPIDLGRDISIRIVGAVSKYGYTSPGEAKTYIGKIGWEIVNRYGGWDYVCKNLGVTLDVGIFQSNVREVARAQCEYQGVSSYEQLEYDETKKIECKNDYVIDSDDEISKA
jgi:hypothetical protein